MKYSVLTFGCRVNQADSLDLEAELCTRGARAAAPDEADVIVVNTCSVTASADQGARQAVRRLHRLNPDARIVVTGCYATRAVVEVETLPGVARVVTNAEKDRLLAEVLPFAPQTTAERFEGGEGACGAQVTPGLAGRTAWTLRVQTGCDQRCSFCGIPSTRGPSRSRRPAEVLAEVEKVVGWGFREIAVTGVHLGSYGRDLVPRGDLTGLMYDLSERAWREPPAREGSCSRPPAGRAAAPIVRYRLSSLEPMDCPGALVDLVAGSLAFAPHFHLPLQHASDRILAAMRRPYTLDAYRRLVDGIRDTLPHAAIGTDVIVGFPGETDRDADTLARYLEQSPITHVHVFPYSDRPGADASRLEPRVHGAAVRERSGRLRRIGQELARRFRGAQLGATRPGLTLEDGTLVVTDNYLKVRIAPGRARNQWVNVRIDEVEPTPRGTVVGSRFD